MRLRDGIAFARARYSHPARANKTVLALIDSISTAMFEGYPIEQLHISEIQREARRAASAILHIRLRIKVNGGVQLLFLFARAKKKRSSSRAPFCKIHIRTHIHVRTYTWHNITSPRGLFQRLWRETRDR